MTGILLTILLGCSLIAILADDIIEKTFPATSRFRLIIKHTTLVLLLGALLITGYQESGTMFMMCVVYSGVSIVNDIFVLYRDIQTLKDIREKKGDLS